MAERHVAERRGHIELQQDILAAIGCKESLRQREISSKASPFAASLSQTFLPKAHDDIRGGSDSAQIVRES